MYFSVTNGLPIALNFRAAFLGRDTVKHKRDTLLTVPVNGGGTVYPIPGASVDPSGSVSQARSTALQITMNSDQVRKFNASDSVYVLLTVNTSGNNTTTPVQAVRIRSTDYVTIRASANMVFILKEKR
jgi:hypothetical protein